MSDLGTSAKLDAIQDDLQAISSALTLWGETQAAHGEQLAQIIDILTAEPPESPVAQALATLDELVREVRALRADVNSVKVALATAMVRSGSGAAP